MLGDSWAGAERFMYCTVQYTIKARDDKLLSRRLRVRVPCCRAVAEPGRNQRLRVIGTHEEMNDGKAFAGRNPQRQASEGRG